jgi:hypothetical protein
MILLKYKKADNAESYLGFMHLCIGEAFYLSGDFTKKKLFVKIGPAEFIRYKDLKKFDFNNFSFSDFTKLMYSVRCLTNGVFGIVPIGVVSDTKKAANKFKREMLKDGRHIYLQNKQKIIHFSFLTKKNISLKKHYKEYEEMAKYEHELFHGRLKDEEQTVV